jgi:hypothetical protein
MTNRSFDSYLEEGNVAFYGYRGMLPDFARAPRVGRTRAFVRGGAEGMRSYQRLQELRDERADVYFLDTDATRVMVADFPGTARYIAVRAWPTWSWFVSLPGIVRRLRLKTLLYEGVRSLKTGDTATRWFVFRHVMTESLHTRLSISEDVGVTGLLAFLKDEQVAYVVQRFFRDLPSLGRSGGDLDLLIADADEIKVKSFLQAHPGPITVDAWTVSRKSFNDITYYPPPIARGIIERAVDGPSGSRVPNPLDALHAFIYHALYHKGVFAGVPSTTCPEAVNKKPENDYVGEIRELAARAGVTLAHPVTMETLDTYLASVEWRPKLDTLAKIAPRNVWVWKYHFSVERDQEVGLGIFLIKARAFQNGTADALLDTIRKTEGLVVLKDVHFTPEDIARVSTELRGGVWHDARVPEGELLPVHAVLVLDETVARKARAGTSHAVFDQRIRAVKKQLRRLFDQGPGSAVHATDNTTETWEYVPVCFPGEEAALRAEVERRVMSIEITTWEKVSQAVRHVPRIATYEFTRLKRRAREWLIALLVR